MTIKVFYAHILRAVSQPNLAERSSRNQRLISPSLPLLLGWHGPSKWCRDLWCAKIESNECHLRWRKGNSAWGKGLDWNVGVRDRDARVRKREWAEGGGGETETFLKGGTAAVTESLEVLTCIWAACQPEQTRVPLPSTAVQLERKSLLCPIPEPWSQRMQRQTTADTQQMLHGDKLLSHLRRSAWKGP